MRPVSKWPWLFRFVVFVPVLVSLWWGPIVLMLTALSRLGVFEKVGTYLGFILACVVLFSWSSFVMKFVIHSHVEPFFNIQSVHNKRDELFEPEPIHSFRDWVRHMFIGRK